MALLWYSILDGSDLPAGLLLFIAAIVVLIAFANDDDLPGPRRCFARAGGPEPRPFGWER
jgi:hypothetical protein